MQQAGSSLVCVCVSGLPSPARPGECLFPCSRIEEREQNSPPGAHSHGFYFRHSDWIVCSLDISPIDPHAGNELILPRSLRKAAYPGSLFIRTGVSTLPGASLPASAPYKTSLAFPFGVTEMKGESDRSPAVTRMARAGCHQLFYADPSS